MPAKERPDRNLAMELVRVTESAALAAASWVGRGDKKGADGQPHRLAHLPTNRSSHSEY